MRYTAVGRVFVRVQHTLGDCEDVYFVESEARTVMESYQRELTLITRAIRARNTATSILYENLIPSWIPNSQYRSISPSVCWHAVRRGFQS